MLAPCVRKRQPKLNKGLAAPEYPSILPFKVGDSTTGGVGDRTRFGASIGVERCAGDVSGDVSGVL